MAQAGMILECESKIYFDGKIPNSMKRTSKEDTAKYRSTAVALTGSDICPAVLYKGRVIDAGRIGTRRLTEI